MRVQIISDMGSFMKRLSVTEAARNFSEVINDVERDREEIILQAPVFLSPINLAEIRLGIELMAEGEKSSVPQPRFVECAANLWSVSPRNC